MAYRNQKITNISYGVLRPLYETEEGVVDGIYNKRINDAVKARATFTVFSFWKGERVSKTFLPKWIRENCEKIEKIYRRPDEPMVEYKIFIPKPLSEEEASKKFMIESGLL